MSRVLVTGAAGFVGAFVSKLLLQRCNEVLGVDNLNRYYDVSLKMERIERLTSKPGFRFERLDLTDREATARFFASRRPDFVVHMAAQAGVRYSIENPGAYVDANLVGFGNVLEGCRQNGVRHLVFASSSSVYGANTRVPFRESDTVDHPVSLYAATKKANELMAHTYSHLYGLPTTGLRFFTVYGPWGRPDMAYWTFTQKILAGEPIDLYGNGEAARDFTYIDDVADGVVRVMDTIPAGDPDWNGDAPNPATSKAPYRIYNIGNHDPVPVRQMVEIIEGLVGRTVEKRLLPLPPGDVPKTYADISALEAAVGFRPSTPLAVGLERFVSWYREYHRV